MKTQEIKRSDVTHVGGYENLLQKLRKIEVNISYSYIPGATYYKEK